MDEEYVERVLSTVERIPPGRVTTYGAVAALVGGGPRQIGSVMARHGGGVAWWRVVRADGTLPPSHQGEALDRYREEGTPWRPAGPERTTGRVPMAEAFWDPAEPEE